VERVRKSSVSRRLGLIPTTSTSIENVGRATTNTVGERRSREKNRQNSSSSSIMRVFIVLLTCFWATGEAFDTRTPFVCRCGRLKAKWPPSRTLGVRRMFTGIVEEVGTVVSLESKDDMTLWDGSVGSGTELVVQGASSSRDDADNGSVVMDGAYLGCSICVSGVCLTATELDFDKNVFKVGLAPETLRRTYFESLKAGDKVNLERASEIGGRNSGHFVQGHVDGTGDIIDKWKDEDSLFFKIKVSPELIKYIVPKGFIAVDGTSLTVVDVDSSDSDNCWFTLMLVAYTQKKIILPSKDIGGKVNIEVDVLGKYSENALAALLPRLEALEAKVETLERQLAKQPAEK